MQVHLQDIQQYDTYTCITEVACIMALREVPIKAWVMISIGIVAPVCVSAHAYYSSANSNAFTQIAGIVLTALAITRHSFFLAPVGGVLITLGLFILCVGIMCARRGGRTGGQSEAVRHVRANPEGGYSAFVSPPPPPKHEISPSHTSSSDGHTRADSID